VTPAEIREAVILTAISASNLISNYLEEDERKRLEDLFRDTFEQERELAEKHGRFVTSWAEVVVPANGDQLIGEAGNT
jgi:hypothetical protein